MARGPRKPPGSAGFSLLPAVLPGLAVGGALFLGAMEANQWGTDRVPPQKLLQEYRSSSASGVSDGRDAVPQTIHVPATAGGTWTPTAAMRRGQAMGAAWDLYHQGRYAEAAAAFETLYRAQPDANSADGLYYSLQHLGDDLRVATLGADLGGPLWDKWRSAEAETLESRKQFAAAEDLYPAVDPVLKHYTAPSIDTGLSFREKSGDPGSSRFRKIVAPEVEGVFYATPVDRISIDAERVTLESDGLAPGQAIGRFPGGGAYAFRPTEDFEDLATFHVRWQREGMLSPYAELSTTPIGTTGTPAAVPTGKLGFVKQEKNGYWSLEASGQPVEESLLSYTGITDPYGGGSWGRVVDVGGTAKDYLGLGSGWGLYAEEHTGWNVGENVEPDFHVSSSLSLAKSLPIPGFDYFTVGPGFLMEHYEKNLSHFTYGQGGYFSPALLTEGVAGVNFLTREGRPYVVQGGFNAGVQANHQDASPFFPLHPDGRSFGNDDNTSFVFSAKVNSVFLIASQWEVGAYAGYAKSADYNDFQGGLMIRFLFERRSAAFSTDLPR